MQHAPFMLFLRHDLSMPWSMNDEAHNRGTNGTDDLCPKWSSKSNNDPRHLFTMRSSWLLNDDMSHLGISAGVDLDENKPYQKRRFWLCLERRLDATVGLLDNVEINHWRMSQCVLVWAVVRLLLGEASAGLLTQTLHDFTSDLWKSVRFNVDIPSASRSENNVLCLHHFTATSSFFCQKLQPFLTVLEWMKAKPIHNVRTCRDMIWYLGECIKI